MVVHLLTYCWGRLVIINDIEDITWPRGNTNFIFEYWKILSARKDKIRIPKRPYNVLFILWILMKFLNKTELFFSANLSECSSSSEKVSMWKFGSSSRKSPVTVPSLHPEAILWMKFQKNRPHAWAGSSLVIGKSCFFCFFFCAKFTSHKTYTYYNLTKQT